MFAISNVGRLIAAILIFILVGAAWYGWSSYLYLADESEIAPLASSIDETPTPNVIDASSSPIQNGEPPKIDLTGKLVEYEILLSQTDYERLQIDGFGTVQVTRGETAMLTVETDSGYRPRVRVEEEPGLLRLGNIYAEDGLRPTLVYTLTVPDIQQLAASGGATVEAVGLTLNRLNITVSGGGTVILTDFEADTLTVNGSGGGEVQLTGRCNVGEIFENMSGGSSFDKSGCQ